MLLSSRRSLALGGGDFKTTVDLPDTDQRRVDKVLAQIAEKRAGRAESLSGLIGKWAGFIREVESGYSQTIYDYTNDLSLRSLLEEVLSVLSPESRATIMSVLAPLDARFHEATQPPPDGRLFGFERDEWSRIPLKIVGEMRDEFPDLA